MLRKDSKEQLRNYNNKEPSLVRSLIGTGVAFLAWGIGLKLAKGASHLINRKAGVAIAEWAYNNKSKLHSFITNVFRRTSKYIRASGLSKDRAQELRNRLNKTVSLYKRLRKETRVSLSTIKEKYKEATLGFEHTRYFVPKSAGLITKIEGKIPNKVYRNIVERDIRATSIFWNLKSVKQHRFLNRLRQIRMSKALLPGGDYFAPASHPKYRMGGSKFNDALKVRIYRYTTSLLATMPFEYTVSRMMDTQHDDKWYSPRSIGNWLKWNISADLTMGFLPGKIFNAAIGRMKSMVQLKGAKGEQFVHKVLGTAERIARSSFMTSLYETSKYMKYINKVGRKNTIKSTIDWMRKVVHNFSMNYSKNSRLPMEYRRTAAMDMERNAISYLSLIDKNRANSKYTTADTMMQFLSIHKIVEENLKKNDPNTWLKKISWMFDKLKTKPRGAESNAIKQMIDEVGFFTAKATDKITGNPIIYGIKKKEGILQLDNLGIDYNLLADRFRYLSKDRYYTPHKGVISFQNKTYDLSNITPQNLFRSMYNILSGVQIFGLHPFKLLGYGPFLNIEDQFTIKRYKAGDLAKVGPMLDPHRLNKLEDFINEKVDIEANNTKGRVRFRIIDKIFKQIKDVNKGDKYITKSGVNSIDVMLDNSGVSAQEEAAKIMMRKRLANMNLSNNNVKSILDKAIETKYQLATGRVKLVSNEEVWYIGKQLYYIPDANARNMKIYQIGLDWKTKKYPLIDLISKENVGSLGVIDDIYGGTQPYVKTTSDGKTTRVRTGIGTKSPISKVKSSDSFVLRQIHKFMDYFDIGTYEQPTFFNRLGHFIRRFTMAKEPRKYFSDEYVFNDKLRKHVINIADSPAKRTFVNLTKNHIRRMQDFALDKIFNSEPVINALNEIGNKRYSSIVKGLDNILESIPFNTDYLYEELNRTSLVDVISLMKQSMNNNFDILDRTDNWKRYSKYINKDEFNFLNILSNDSPLDVISHLSIMNSYEAGIEFIKRFHNIRSKILLASLKDSEINYITKKVSNTMSRSAMNKLSTALNIVKIMNKNVDDENIFDTLLTNKNVHELMGKRLDQYFTIIKDNRDVFEKYAKYADPIWKMKGSPNVKLYGGGGTSGDIFLSQNKTAKGEYIRSFWDTFLPKTIHTEEGWDVPEGMLTKAGAMTMATIHAINNTAATIGLGFNLENMRTPTMFMKNIIFKRIVPAIGIAAAWQVADTFVDYFPLFDGTSLQNGLNSFIADQIATVRLSIARFNDVIGITDSARYLENLLPGSINSPLAGALRGFGFPLLGSALGAAKGGPKGGLIGGAIGLGLSLITAGGPVSFITGDWLTKRRADIIEEYAGRKLIPHHRQSGWLVSSSPFAGTGIDAFLPSWYTRIHSDYKHTDVLYGSKFEQLISVFDPHYYFEKHKYTRPYPFSGGFLENVPMIGNIISIGGETGDYPEMQLDSAIDNGDVNYSPNMETLGLMSGYKGTATFRDINPTTGLSGSSLSYYNSVKPMLPTSLPSKLQQTFYGATELMGLRGFITQTLFTEFNNDMFPYEDIPVYQSASLMTSPTRQYWDNMPSDPLALMEMVRRFVPRRGEHVSEWNGLVNAMPQWMPEYFKTGDPYVKIRLGEARLPGPGIEAWRNIKYTIPLEAEYMGLSPEEQLKYMTGNHLPVDPNERFTKLLGGKVAKQIADTLQTMNNSVKINQYVFNPFLNISGKFDIVVNNRAGMKVKVLTNDVFNKLTGPRPQDVGEMNALLNIGRNIKQGTIIYINAQTGDTKEFQVNADPTAFQQELRRTNAVRNTALNIINDHKNKIGKAGLGYAYSRVDRLAILGDIAPNSPEYRETLKEINELDKLNMLTPEDRQKVYITVTQVARKRDQFRYTERKFTRGTPATEEEEIYQQAIKHEYNFVERSVGALWERLTFRDSIITSRFINNVTPIDVYRKYYVYGEGPVRQWQHPYTDFIRPYGLSALNRDNIVDSISSMSTAGFVFGGPVGAGLGAIAGATWWMVHGKETVPDFTQRRSELLKQLDAIQYIKAQQSMQMGDVTAKWKMMNTMTYTFNNNASVEQMIRSLPKTEQEFVRHFANASTVEERERIMNLVPDYAKYVLDKAWSTGTNAYIDKTKNQTMNNPMQDLDLPSPFWAGFDPAIKTEDIKVKILENEGYNARAVGVGFQAQKRRMLRTPFIPESFTQKMQSTMFPDNAEINNIVKSIFPGAEVSILPTQLPGIKLIIKGNYIDNNYSNNYMRNNYGI